MQENISGIIKEVLKTQVLEEGNSVLRSLSGELESIRQLVGELARKSNGVGQDSDSEKSTQKGLRNWMKTFETEQIKFKYDH